MAKATPDTLTLTEALTRASERIADPARRPGIKAIRRAAHEGRIEGATKRARAWFVPVEAFDTWATKVFNPNKRRDPSARFDRP